jgi:predicted ferric reductase
MTKRRKMETMGQGINYTVRNWQENAWADRLRSYWQNRSKNGCVSFNMNVIGYDAYMKQTQLPGY